VDRSTSTVPILVIDDDQDYRILLRYQLEAAGYEVLESADGNTAYAVIASKTFNW